MWVGAVSEFGYACVHSKSGFLGLSVAVWLISSTRKWMHQSRSTFIVYLASAGQVSALHQAMGKEGRVCAQQSRHSQHS